MAIPVHVENLGLLDYKKCWDYQEQLNRAAVGLKLKNRKELNFTTSQGINNRILLVEHPHVYTLGKSGDRKNLLISDEKLNQIKASFYKINRGGDITYHGPGQLVMYPILDLEQFFTDIHKYLRFLEETVILTLKEFGIEAGRYEGYTGVWIDSDKPTARKICAMGIRVSRWVTMHGIALNVNSDLSYFDHIVPCGIKEKDVASMHNELNLNINLVEVQEVLLQKMKLLFDIEFIK